MAALLVVVGVQSFRLVSEQARHAQTREDHALQIGELERAGREGVERVRREEARRYESLKGVVDDAQKALDEARRDAAGAAGVADRLRQRFAALAAGCRAPSVDPSPADGREAARSPADLLADVQRRLDEAAGSIAEHADAARVAGSACERAYGALTP